MIRVRLVTRSLRAYAQTSLFFGEITRTIARRKGLRGACMYGKHLVVGAALL